MSSSSPESWTRRHNLDVTRKKLVKSGFLPSPSKNNKKKTVTSSSPSSQPVSPENTVSSQTILSSSTSNINNNSNSTFKRKNTNASSSAGLNRSSTSLSGFSRMMSSSPKASASSSSMLAAGGSAGGSDAANAESEMLFPIRLNWMGVQKSESSVVFKARDPEAEAEFSRSQRASMLVRVRNLLDKNKQTSGGNSSDQTGAFSREALEKGFVSYLDGSYGHSRNALNKFNGFVREKMIAVLEDKKKEYLRLKNTSSENNSNTTNSEDQKSHTLSPEQIALIEAADGDENYFNASCNFPSNQEFGPLPPLEEGKGLIPSNSLSATNWREFKGHEGTVGYNFRAATSAKEISDKYPFFKDMKLGEDFISPSTMGTPRESTGREEEDRNEQERQAEAERQRKLQQEKEEEEERRRKLKEQQEEEEKRQRELREQEEEQQKQRSLKINEMNEEQLGATDNSLQKSSSQVCKSPPRLPPRKPSVKSSEEADTAAAAAASQQQQSPKPKEKEKSGCCG